MQMDLLGLIVSVVGIIVSIISTIVGIVPLFKDHSIVAEQCMIFQRIVIPAYQAALKFYSEHQLNVLSIKIDWSNGVIRKPSKNKKGTEEFLQAVMLMFNDMDMFAMQVLEMSTKQRLKAYKMQGHAYCDIIDSLKPIYELFKIHSAKDYVNMINLYNVWKQA